MERSDPTIRESNNKTERVDRMQGSKLYVGNLGYAVTIDHLQELFSNYGNVLTVNIVEGKGFGFVEMSNQSEAEKAKKALNGSDFKGRSLKINEALPDRGRQRRDQRR
jgi:RNA recognition motif-containing protein